MDGAASKFVLTALSNTRRSCCINFICLICLLRRCGHVPSSSLERSKDTPSVSTPATVFGIPQQHLGGCRQKSCISGGGNEPSKSSKGMHQRVITNCQIKVLGEPSPRRGSPPLDVYMADQIEARPRSGTSTN
eukprot:6212970-Pleurochrysis_carterae.AAC.2